MLKYFISILILMCSLWGNTVQSENPMRNHIAVKGLVDVKLVVRHSDVKKVMTIEELFDAYKVNVRQRIPDLRVKKESENWLEFSYIIQSGAGFVEISLYRSVTVTPTGERLYAKVWEDMRLITGDIGRKGLIEGLDILLTSFGADFIEANQKEKNK